MKTRLVLLLLATVFGLTTDAWAAAARTATATNGVPNDFDKTVRVVRDQRVDLKPLALWLRERHSQAKSSAAGRPLSAWKIIRVEGITNTSALNWVVQATVDGANATLVLQNPPKKELDEFNQLKGLHAQLLARTNELARELKRVQTARRQTASQEESLLRRRSGKWGPVGAVEQRAGALAAEEHGLTLNLEAARQQLRQIEAKGYDFKKPFVMDCLALKTGEELYGKPVYDRGQTFN